MKQVLWLAYVVISANLCCAQSFEISSPQETYKGQIGEIIKASIKFRNTTEKPITLIIRKLNSQIGVTQKNYFCIDNNCLDPKVEDFMLKIDPNQSFNSLQFVLEAGLALGTSSVKYVAINKANPAEIHEFELFFNVDERSEKKQSIYTSASIDLQEVFPNPAEEYAYVNYKILNDQVKAKIVLYNILGNQVDEYPLPPQDTRVKIRTETLSPGVYFYTLYIDDDSHITCKLVRK
jgi:hypothetical protein